MNAHSPSELNRINASAATEQPTATGSLGGQRMRAIVQKEYGTADMLRVAEIEQPAIGADEVLVQVHAAVSTEAPGI